MIIKRLHQLFKCLSERKILTWQFFASRFETLIAEIHVIYDKSVDYTGTSTAR